MSSIKDWMQPCRLCPIACGAKRLDGEVGVCGAGAAQIYRHGEQLGEERHLVPSYVVDFSQCNLGCTFCSERKFWDPTRSISLDPHEFAEEIITRYSARPERLRSIQWVGGEPSIHLGFIEQASLYLKEHWKGGPRLLLNTNGYYSTGLAHLIRPFVDGFVFDFKIAPNCGDLLGQRLDYHEVLEANIIEALKYWEPEDIVIRHLLLPDHGECCADYVLRWCGRHAASCYINVMDGYIDFEKPWIGITKAEREGALNLGKSLGLRRLCLNGRLCDVPLAGR
ncbi:MAG: radical SAM protein [Bradymonadales bacterium]